MTGYDWEARARRAGVTADGRFNAGTVDLGEGSALIWRREDGTRQDFSGDDVHRHAAALAAALVSLGVKRGDRVGGILARRPECFALPLAVWRIGAIYVPLFSGFGSDALEVRLRDSGATALVIDAPNAAAVQPVRDRLPQLLIIGLETAGDLADRDLEDAIARAGARAPIADTDAHEPATIMYTSGTTGTPKGCVIPHRGIISLWPFVEHCLGLGAGATLFSTADAGWSFGLLTTGLAPMSLGVTRVLYEGAFDPATWWRVAAETRAEHLASAPTGFRQLGGAGEDAIGGADLGSLAGATSCGEPLTTEIVEWFQRRFGFPICDSYGATELGIVVADLRRPQRPVVSGSMGEMLPGFELKVVDDGGNEVGDGEPGRAAVRDHGWLLSVGYWERMADWEARLQDGWWVTEDIICCDGGRYSYVGRADDVIVTAGYNVGPADVESVILQHPAVADAACVAESDPRKGSVVAVHLVPAGNADVDEDALLDEIRANVGERIGWHAAPRRIHIAESLPRTESGKVRRAELRRATVDAATG